MGLPTIQRSSMRPARTAAALAVAAAATGAAVPATALTWAPCEDLGEPAPGVRCATLDVPLDYARPDGTRIRIAVSRRTADGPAGRRGVLVLNPGGTDRSELAMPARLVAQGLPDEVRGRYDLVTFDPRGVGRSAPATCDLQAGQELNIPPSPYARDTGDVLRSAALMRTIAHQCGASKTGYLLPHMSTADVARDMDRVRAALGEERISYLGYSYGTYLGAVYATLFPRRTDRIVLDGVVGPGGMDHTWSRRLAEGVEQRFPDFARWAAARNRTYGLGATPRQVRDGYFRLASRLDRAPAGTMDGPGFRYLTFSSLFSDQTFPALAKAWRALAETWRRPGPGAAGDLPGRDEPADFSGMIQRSCSDAPWPHDISYYARTIESDRSRFPMFGASAAGIWPCAFWPSRPTGARIRIGAAGPSNILLVSFTRDPGTPWRGAAEMRVALGRRARLLAVDGGGHMVYLSGASACADTIVTRFLASGVRPVTDSRCGSNTVTSTGTQRVDLGTGRREG
ncbi:alpha/beta hydrolase [Actinomadura fibrosa]|uniref:Alpha/beta hydrolase n=1 Tax=Actinomadura fibrosa TaxID=111802 RepID=A0ABW2Y355_9ACTN|nr:alpha/beta hydrolase [Actinomadura fibrosa]